MRVEDNIHVLHVVPGLGPGGMELTMSRVITALTDGGIRHSIACLKGQAHIADRLPDETDIHCFHSRPNEPQLPARLGRLIRMTRPTVIHARNWGAWPDSAVGRLLARPITPMIFSFHGLGSAGFMPLRRRLASRVLVRMTTHLFTVSRQTKQMLVERWGWPERRVGVIPNGVDTNRFKPAGRGARRKTLLIGSVGGLRPVKNHALLVRACARLAADGADLELRIAGAGTEKDNLIRLANSLDFAGRLRLFGQVDDVPAFLGGLDIFALSSAGEAHPNALIEAMACGLACVATRVGGVDEVLQDGRFGLIVEPGNVTALAAAIAELASDRQSRRDLGDAARGRVCERYDMERMLDAYAALYRQASANRPARPAGQDRTIKGDTRPRVLMLGPLPPPTGGMATVVSNLAGSDLARRCRLTIINNGKTTRADRTMLSGITAQAILLGRLVVAILRRRIRLVHIHTCSGFTFWRDCLHLAAALFLGRRVIWHIHGGYFDRFASAQGRGRRRLLRIAIEAGSAVIVLSRDWRDRLRPIAPAARWRVVHNGVPIPERIDRSASERVRFIFLGNLGEDKGVHDLVEATAAASRGGFRGLVSLAGGESVPGQRDQLQRLISELGCRSQVTLLGEVTGREKDQALAGADCFVLPSHAEGLPMALLEAMARAMPVVATTVGAIPEVVRDGVEGFLVAPGDVEALAGRMTALDRDPALRQRMGEAARKRVRAHYSMDGMVDRIMDVYDELPADDARITIPGREKILDRDIRMSHCPEG